MSKEDISRSYVEDWRLRTADYLPQQDRRALVVGCSPGNIGSHIATSLELHGFKEAWRVTIDDVDLTRSDDTVEFFYRHGNERDTLILSNGYTHLDWIEDQPTQEIYNTIDNTLCGSILATREFVKSTIDEEHLKYIVFVGSMAYSKVLNGSAVYCAAKAGLAHFAECVAYELAPKGYRVFCVHPGNVQGTPMTTKTIEGLRRYRGITVAEAKDYWSSGLLMPEFLKPEEIGDTVAWLVSGKADHMTGSQIELKGGQR